MGSLISPSYLLLSLYCFIKKHSIFCIRLLSTSHSFPEARLWGCHFQCCILSHSFSLACSVNHKSSSAFSSLPSHIVLVLAILSIKFFFSVLFHWVLEKLLSLAVCNHRFTKKGRQRGVGYVRIYFVLSLQEFWRLWCSLLVMLKLLAIMLLFLLDFTFVEGV